MNSIECSHVQANGLPSPSAVDSVDLSIPVDFVRFCHWGFSPLRSGARDRTSAEQSAE